MIGDNTGTAITASTRLVCLLGHPARHSRSPLIHNAAFERQGVDMAYLAFDVAPADLESAVRGLRALGVVGANVTVPHKEAVLPLLDFVDPVAQTIGAVNTIMSEDGRLCGYNTDMKGFLIALERAWGRGPAGSRCLVLGAGGAARAVVSGLATAGAAHIWVFNRTAARSHDLCTQVGSWSKGACRPILEDELAQAAAQADVIVNATSIGMGDSVKLSPIAVDVVTRRHVVADLVYGREPTALVARARSLGAICLDGLEMLVQQAALSYELWTGRMAPVDLMREMARYA